MSRLLVPTGLGNDICHIPRIHNILLSPRGVRFIMRILTEDEILAPRPQRILRCVLERSPPSAQAEDLAHTRMPAAAALAYRRLSNRDLWQAAEFLAGRFAAKEATIKAYRQYGLTFQDIKIKNEAPPTRQHRSEGGEEEVKKEDGVPEREEQARAAKGELPAISHSSGPPALYLRQDISMSPENALLTISHDGEYASAVCLALGPPSFDVPDKSQKPGK